MLRGIVRAGCAVTVLTFAQLSFGLEFRATDANPLIDGTVGVGEWSKAGSENDGGGLAGATYAMWRNTLNYAGGISYGGKFQFLLHNIEQNPDNNNAAYNVFDIYRPGNTTDRYLQIWVFNDVDETVDDSWMGAAASNLTGLTGTSSIDDRGFGVYNFETSQWRQFLPGATPQAGSYDWDLSWGVYAVGAYNNSAYTAGLSGATDNANQIFEVVYRVPDPNWNEAVRRSVSDPDRTPYAPPKEYKDVIITTIPEPATLALFGIGLAGLAGRRCRQSA